MEAEEKNLGKSQKSALFLEAESDTSQSDDSACSSSEESEERDTKKTKRKKKSPHPYNSHYSLYNEIQREDKGTNWKVATNERSAEVLRMTK